MQFKKNHLGIKNILCSEDAVSEVVDFVTIFGVLILSIGLIGVAGYPILKSAQEARYIENTKQSFIVLADNTNKVVFGQAPSQSMELKMYGEMLRITGNSVINITAKNSSGDVITLVDQQMRSIESTVGDTVIAYEGTGVWARYPDGSTLMIYKPLITSRDNMLIIPVVTVIGSSSISGSGLSRVTVYGTPRIDFYNNVNNITVTINNSDYRDGWEKYFNDMPLWINCTEGDNMCASHGRENISLYILNINLNSEVI